MQRHRRGVRRCPAARRWGSSPGVDAMGLLQRGGVNRALVQGGARQPRYCRHVLVCCGGRENGVVFRPVRGIQWCGTTTSLQNTPAELPRLRVSVLACTRYGWEGLGSGYERARVGCSVNVGVVGGVFCVVHKWAAGILMRF